MDNQTILISGASGNVGGGAAVALAKRGANIVLLGRKLEPLEKRANSILAALPQETVDAHEPAIDALAIDFSDMDSVQKAAAEALDRYPKIDGLILSAVALLQGGPTILPNGHEIMFATNVLGPFLFSQLLLNRLEQSHGMVLHVIAPFYQEIDWDDLESIENHHTNTAYERTKTMHRSIAGEMARRYAGKIASVAFDPGFIINKTDPELEKRWPSGFMGFFWKVMTLLFAKPPEVAGEPMTDLLLSYADRDSLNGALYKLDKRAKKPDKAMNDEVLGQRLWDELLSLTASEAA